MVYQVVGSLSLGLLALRERHWVKGLPEGPLILKAGQLLEPALHGYHQRVGSRTLSSLQRGRVLLLKTSQNHKPLLS